MLMCIARIQTILTNSGQQTRDSGAVSLAGGLVLAHDTAADTLNNTDLGGLLVVELAQAEGESTELLDNLGQGLAGAGALEAVGGGGTAVESGAVVKGLDLTGSQRETNLNTPNLTNLGDTVTTGTVAGGENNLLLALNLVAAKEPAGSVLNNIDLVGLGDLLDQRRDVGLGRGLLGGGLLLLLIGTLGQKTGGDHESQQKLVGVVGSKNEVSLAAGNNFLSGTLLGDDNHVANNGSESINLSTKLDLDDLAGLQNSLGLGDVGHQRGVGSDIGARGDSGGVADTFSHTVQSVWIIFTRPEGGQTLEDLLSLVDLGDLLVEELVTLLTDLDDLFALNAKS